MKERVLITGANGSLARKLGNYFEDKGLEVVFLSTTVAESRDKIYYWDPPSNQIDLSAFDNCSYIVHLCGYSILKPWTKKNKKLMYDSRVLTSLFLLKKCQEINLHIKAFITASAIGYYGMDACGVKDELDDCGKDWLSKLCYDWEMAAESFRSISDRVIKLRISLLIDPSSGFLYFTKSVLRKGIAPVFGNGKSFIEWIHIDDAVRFIFYAMRNPKLIGPYNLASPNKTTHYEFIKILRKHVNRYSIIIFLPEFFLKIFLREKSRLIIYNYQLSSEKMLSSGYRFKFLSSKDLINPS